MLLRQEHSAGQWPVSIVQFPGTSPRLQEEGRPGVTREEAHCLVDSPGISAEAGAPVLPDHREARRNSVQPRLGWCPVARPSGSRAQRWNGNSCLLCSGAPLFLKLSGLRGLNHVRLRRRASSPSTPQDLPHLKEFQRTLLILLLGYSSRSLSCWEVCTVV